VVGSANLPLVVLATALGDHSRSWRLAAFALACAAGITVSGVAAALAWRTWRNDFEWTVGLWPAILLAPAVVALLAWTTSLVSALSAG
jgi:hypothetical protein